MRGLLSQMLLGILGLSGCEEPPPETEGGLVKQAKQGRPEAPSPDRLPEGQLLEGDEEAFGFRFPRDMQVTHSRKRARAAGRVDFDALTDYVKARVLARHAEMFGPRLVFPRVKIRGQKEGIYKVTLLQGAREQVLLIEDESKPPATIGLTEEQRWKQAGLKPNGELIDPKGMQ